MKHYPLAFSELGIYPELILSEMGYGNVIPEAPIVDAVHDLLYQVQQEVQPECAFLIEKGELSGPEMVISSTTLKPGLTINSLLKHSTHFALFVATAGLRFEEMMKEVKREEDILKAYLLDTIGSWIAEKAGDCMEKYLEAEIGTTDHSNRLSPGYCGWPLPEQKKIFALMGGNPCRITLSDVYLMNPIKSISGVIGIGENVSKKLYACHVCELETCYKRKK